MGLERRRIISTRVIVLVTAVTLALGFWAGMRFERWLRAYEKSLATIPSGGFVLTSDAGPDEDVAGRWGRVNTVKVNDGLTGKQKERMEQVLSLGYLDGSQPAPASESVTTYDPDQAYHGLNLVVSAHAPEAFLMDMEGRTLYTWHRSFAEVWPDREDTTDFRGSEYWRRVYLFDNGDILAIFDGLGMVKLDADSRVIWANPKGFHHDMQVCPDGTIYTLMRSLRIVPSINPSDPVFEDFIAVLNARGRLIRKVSLLKSFENSPYAPMLASISEFPDIFHTNTVEILDGSLADRIPAFARGNVLVSVHQLSAVAVVDLDAESIVWATTGMWRYQHQPTVLENGDIMVLDNLGYGGKSQIVEFDPATLRVKWTYKGTTKRPFFTMTCGSNQRLPNGNTLITSSDPGHAFEVTPEGQVVWEYVNPHRAGDQNQFIATLFEVVRLNPDFPTDWIASRRTQTHSAAAPVHRPRTGSSES